MSDFVSAKYVLNNLQGGIQPSNMISFVVSAGDAKVKIKYEEPADTVIEGQTIATVKGVRILVKEGSAPADEEDGTVVLECEELGKYKTTAFEYDGLTNGTEYYFAAFPYTDRGFYNINKANIRTCTPKEYILFGYYIDEADTDPATRVHYIEMNESFTPSKMNTTSGLWEEGSWTEDIAWFLKYNLPAMVKPDGTVAYFLDKNDHTKKADGTAADITGTTTGYNAMASIPLIWTKRYREGTKRYHLLCNVQLDDTYHCYAHTREDGSIEPYTWIPMYGGSLNSNKCMSLSGKSQMNTQTGTNEITYCKNNGTLWNAGYDSIMQLKRELEVLITRSTDSQESIGYGNYTGGSAAGNLSTTGLNNAKGRFYGYGSSTNKPAKSFFSEMGTGAWERYNGHLYINGIHYIKPYGEYNETGANYINLGVGCAGTSGGYINGILINEYGEYPITISGTSTTNEKDGCWFNNSGTMHALAFGNCAVGALCGFFARRFANAVSSSSWAISARPYCKTPTTADISDLEIAA